MNRIIQFFKAFFAPTICKEEIKAQLVKVDKHLATLRTDIKNYQTIDRTKQREDYKFLIEVCEKSIRTAKNHKAKLEKYISKFD